MWWLALWGSTMAFNIVTATATLVVDSNTYVMTSSTQGIRQAVYYVMENTDVDVDDSYWKAFRMREQGLYFDPTGKANLILKAGTPAQFPVVWNRLSTVPMVLNPSTPVDSTLHYSLAVSSTALMGYVTLRHKQTSETPKIYWGNEMGFFHVWNDYISPLTH